MEETVLAAVTLKTLWVSGSLIVGVIIWVYKLWHDTKLNKEAITHLKTKHEVDLVKLSNDYEKKIVEIKNEHKEFKKLMYAALEKTNMEMRDGFKEMSTNIESFFNKHEERELEEQRILYERLERIIGNLTEIKVELAKKADK